MAMFLYLFVLLLAVKISASEPNIQFSITDKGLKYVNKLLVKNLVNQVKGLAIPPITLRAGITLRLDKSRVHQVHLKSTSFGVKNGRLELEIRMSQLSIGGDYVSRGWFFFNGNGRFTVDLKGLDIIQRLSLERNDKGQPLVLVPTAGCSTRIHMSSYRFDHSFILSMISNLAKRSFQPMVERKICQAVSKAIQKKAAEVPDLYPENHPLPGVPCTIVSFPITEQPIVEQDYVDVLITGQVESLCRPLNTSSAPANQTFVRFVPNQDKMLSISMSDDFLNLLFTRYYNAAMMASIPLNQNSSSKVDIAPSIKTTVNGSILYFKNYAFKLLFQLRRKKLSAKIINLRTNSSTRLDSKVIKKKTSKFIKKLNGTLKRVIPLPLVHSIRLVGKKVIYQQGRITVEMDIQV